MSSSSPLPKDKAFLIFGLLAWGHYCILGKLLSYPDHKLVPNFIYYPLWAILEGTILDNIRLAVGSFYGKEMGGGLRFFTRLSYFVHMAIVPSLIGTFTSLWSGLGVWWLVETLGAIACVPFCVNGMNEYVSEVHDYLEYHEDDGLPRFRLKNSQVSKLSDFPHRLTFAGAIITSLIVWFVAGDVMPLLLQLGVLTLHVAQTSVPDCYKVPVVNSSEILFLGGLVRCLRYI